jgi:hypothetical protein
VPGAVDAGFLVRVDGRDGAFSASDARVDRLPLAWPSPPQRLHLRIRDGRAAVEIVLARLPIGDDRATSAARASLEDWLRAAGDDPQARILLGNLGDAGLAPDAIAAAGLRDLLDTLPESARYTRRVDGLGIAEERILAGGALLGAARAPRVEIVRINADASETHRGDPTLPLRVSDRDPVIGIFPLD